MKVLRFLAKLACCLGVCAGLAGADSIQLRNGRHLQGKYIGGTTNAIGFMTSGSVEYFATTEVLVLIFDNTNEPPLSGLQPNPMKGRPAVSGVARVRRISASRRTRIKQFQRQSIAASSLRGHSDANLDEKITDRESDSGQRRSELSKGVWPSSP